MDCHTVCNILNVRLLGGGKTASLSSDIQAYKASGRRQSMSFFVALVAVFCVCMSSFLVSCSSDHPDMYPSKKRAAPADTTQSSAIIMSCDTTWGDEIHQNY